MTDPFEDTPHPDDPLDTAERQGRAIEEIPEEVSVSIDTIIDQNKLKRQVSFLYAEYISGLMTPLQREVFCRQFEMFPGKFADSPENIAADLNEHSTDRSIPSNLTADDIVLAEAKAIEILKEGYPLALRCHQTVTTDKEVRKITPPNATPHLM